MDSTWINAPAKINLGLDVLRRLDNGYHEVKMIMQSVGIYDVLSFKKSEKSGIYPFKATLGNPYGGYYNFSAYFL